MTTAQLTIKKSYDKVEMSNFILYSLGKFVSIFGTTIYSFAIGLHVLRITGSGLNFATTLIIGAIPRVVIYPFAGVLADKFNKKVLVVTMDLLNGVVLVGVYYLSTIYGFTVMMIYASTFIMTVFTAFFDISLEAAKPNLVRDKTLMSINSAGRIIDSVSSILGPMIGGMIFAFIDIKIFIIVNGVSFIFSGISEMFIDFKYNYRMKDKVQKHINVIKDMREGFLYLFSKKDIIKLFFTFISLNFFLGFSVSVPLPYIINNVLNLESSYFGIIQGAFPAGIIAGALIVNKAADKIPYSSVLTVTSFILSICMVAIGIPVLLLSIRFSSEAYLAYYCGIMVVMGVCISFIDIPIAYIIQKNIPDEYRGRVFSIGISIGKIILPVALVVSGLLLNVLPAYFITAAGGLLLMLFIVLTKKSS
jgi:MFS family permease